MPGYVNTSNGLPNKRNCPPTSCSPPWLRLLGSNSTQMLHSLYLGRHALPNDVCPCPSPIGFVQDWWPDHMSWFGGLIRCHNRRALLQFMRQRYICYATYTHDTMSCTMVVCHICITRRILFHLLKTCIAMTVLRCTTELHEAFSCIYIRDLASVTPLGKCWRQILWDFNAFKKWHFWICINDLNIMCVQDHHDQCIIHSCSRNNCIFRL